MSAPTNFWAPARPKSPTNSPPPARRGRCTWPSPSPSASWEQATTKDTWRQTYHHDLAAAVLTAMGGWGYELSDIETRLIAGTSHQPN